MKIREIFLSDLYRYQGAKNKKEFLKHLLLTPGFKYLFWMRICHYLNTKKGFYSFFYIISRMILRRYKFKYGISIPYNANIGKGFYIGHFGGIFINKESIIGDNCNISQGVTLGQKNRGKYKGSPKIGNNVYIGPDVKIIGGITVGNNVCIGANCVVTKDISDNAVVVGIPAKVISYNGSDEYVTFKWNK